MTDDAILPLPIKPSFIKYNITVNN